MPDEFFYEWTTQVRDIYRDVIGKSDPLAGTTKADAKAVAAQRIRVLVDSGDLKVPVDTAILAAIDKADSDDGGSADRVIARLMRGEDALDLDGDPALDMVVILGEGKRKPLRNVGQKDLRDMDSNRYRNFHNAAQAYDEWRTTFELAMAGVVKHGSFGAAVESGAFNT